MTEDEANAAMDQGLQDLEDTTLRLIDAVTAMSDRLNTTEQMQLDLAATMRGLRDEQNLGRRRSRTLAILAVSVLLDLALTVVVGYLFHRVDSNTTNISDIQGRTSSLVLCPLYGVLVQQIDNAPKDAGDQNGDGVVSGAEAAAYGNTVRVIREGYDALDCLQPKS